MPSMSVTVATRLGRMSARSMPWRTARLTYSGKSAAELEVWKNFSTQSLPLPLTLMSKRLSWRENASKPSRQVPV